MTGVRQTHRWTVRNATSSATFEVRNLGVIRVRGALPITRSWAEVDEDGQPVSVHADLDLAAIDTGNARRDRDLAKPRLLDLARYPTLTFRGGPGELEGTSGRVPGRIAAHGAEVDVSLSVVRDGNTVIATTSFDRRALGIRALRFLIGRRIDVRIVADLVRDEG